MLRLQLKRPSAKRRLRSFVWARRRFRQAHLNTEYARRVCEQIGAALKDLTREYTVVLRSTLLPGTTRRELLPRLEKFSGKAEGNGFNIAYNPEFLREGTAVADFFAPPKTVIRRGTRSQQPKQSADLYKGLPGAFHSPRWRKPNWSSMRTTLSMPSRLFLVTRLALLLNRSEWTAIA